MKRCARCSDTKPHSAFHRSVVRSDGRQVYCIACRAGIDHARYERRVGRTLPRRSLLRYGSARRAWLLSLKAGRPCTDCGRVYRPEAMQWDHLPGFEKRGDISSDFWGQHEDDILREVAKCELVCANCHAIRTFRRGGWGKWSVQESEARYARHHSDLFDVRSGETAQPVP